VIDPFGPPNQDDDLLWRDYDFWTVVIAEFATGKSYYYVDSFVEWAERYMEGE